LVAAQFHVQTVRAQKVVEYSLAPLEGTGKAGSQAKEGASFQDKKDYLPEEMNRGKHHLNSRDQVIYDTREALLRGVLALEKELSPSHRLIPEIVVTHAPEWGPLGLPVPIASKNYSGPHYSRTGGPTPMNEPFTFLLFVDPVQVPIFCAQSDSGLVSLRAFTIQGHTGNFWLDPLDSGIHTLIQPIIRILGILPMDSLPTFPLQYPGPVAKRMNEAWEMSKLRDSRGVLWSLVDHQLRHPVSAGV
jgi:hypothetical protein